MSRLEFINQLEEAVQGLLAAMDMGAWDIHMGVWDIHMRVTVQHPPATLQLPLVMGPMCPLRDANS